jgi:hypothetical protein
MRIQYTRLVATKVEKALVPFITTAAYQATGNCHRQLGNTNRVRGGSGSCIGAP